MPAQTLSAERVEDSSDSESDSTNPTQTLKATVKKIRQNSNSTSAVTIRSDEDSSDDSDTASQASSSSSASSAGSSGKRKADDAVTTLTESTAKRAKTAGTATKRIESTIYVPPHGFVASKFAAHDFSSKTKAIFEGLEGKQIWHISAPSSMPMSKLESLDMESALKGTPILSRKGIQYILQRNALEGQNLLIPQGTVGEYSASTCLPSRYFQIHEGVQRPEDDQVEAEKDDDATALEFFATKTGKKKPPRKQPQNLHGRYVPYGVDRNGIQSSEDIAMGNTAESEQSPQATPRTPKKSRKNRSENAENEESLLSSKKKLKSKGVSEATVGSPIVTDSHRKKRKDKTVSSSQ